MKIKLSVISNVVGCSVSTGEDWGANYGRPEMQSYIDRDIIPRINAEMAPGWTLTFTHSFSRIKNFGIYKRGINYLADKEKEVFICTPIPDCLPETPWGIRQSKMEKLDFEKSNPLDPKRYIIVPFDYKNYNDMKEYVMDCTFRGLHDLFTQGYTVAGKKIKFIK
jgi:hypothetical protein